MPEFVENTVFEPKQNLGCVVLWAKKSTGLYKPVLFKNRFRLINYFLLKDA
jgi:hypothetical protein